jgi:hypothetical protein
MASRTLYSLGGESLKLPDVPIAERDSTVLRLSDLIFQYQGDGQLYDQGRV